MQCFHLLTGYRRPDGSGRLVFERPTGHSGAVIKVPCRQCIGCRVNKEIEWSIRMMHEVTQHQHNQFVTLTYNDENIPWDNSLDHSHIQKFMRALRKKTRQKLRFFVSGEYTPDPHKSRPHYHLVIFGLDLTDLEPTGAKNGNTYYHSQLIADTWGRGFVTIGESVTRSTCVYVAGYLLKDTAKQWEWDWAWPHVMTGEIVKRKPPYCKMSNRPGIGKAWYDKFTSDVFPDDFIVMDGKKFATPGYYRTQLQKTNPELFDELRAKREQKLLSRNYRLDNTPQRIAVKEKCALAKVGDKTDRDQERKGSIGRGKFRNKSGGMTADQLSN